MMTDQVQPINNEKARDDDEEKRIRERLRAKLDNRNRSTTSKLTSNDDKDAQTNESQGTGKDNDSNGRNKDNVNDKSKGASSSEKLKDATDSDNKPRTELDQNKNNDDSNPRRRRRRHRGGRNQRRRRAAAGGPPIGGGPPMGGGPPPHYRHPHPHMMPPMRRGSRSPPGGMPPPRHHFDHGYGPPPPGPYGGGGGGGYRGGPNGYGGGPPPPPYGYDWRGPPRGPLGPPGGPGVGRYGAFDDFGRRLPPRRSRSPLQGGEPYRRGRSYSRSRSRSRSNSPRDRRSRSRSDSSSGSSSSESSRSTRSSRTSRSSKSSRSSRRSRSSSGSSSRSYSDDESQSTKGSVPQDEYTKDQRTVFVTQLVMRTTEREIEKFFRKQGLKTNEVILLRDKRTGRNKGSAYVELRRMDDLGKALDLSGKPPDFQRFPILIKSSEAEKNYALSNKAPVPSSATTTTEAITMTIPKSNIPPIPAPLIGPNGKLIQSQKLYVGNLDPSVSQEHLFALFNPFGQLEQVNVQKSENGVSKGFAFLQFRDPKEANLALQTMSGRILVGRPIKTGWANQVSANPNMEVVTSLEFPEDSTSRAQKAYMVLAQMTNGIQALNGNVAFSLGSLNQPDSLATGSGTSRVPTVAEARASLAAQTGNRMVGSVVHQGMAALPHFQSTAPAIDAMKIGNADKPSKTVLVHNMYDKDEETDEGWQIDIREEFQEECSKYGKIVTVLVMHTEPGGKIYATFDSIVGAQNCASNLAGRWFDKRQLRVEFVADHAVPMGVTKK